MFCQYCLNVRNLYPCGTLADIKDMKDLLFELNHSINPDAHYQQRASAVNIMRSNLAIVSQWTLHKVHACHNAPE